MDQQRARIQEDLRGLVAGEVRCDDVFRQLYASDASIYQILPLGVVLPQSTHDVVATVKYAAEHQIPIHARGAGTGLSGESLGPGLVLDFSKNLRRIIGTDGHTVRVQPGVVHERLNAYLRPLGRVFGPDPAMSHVTTMGSVIALDGSGSHWLKHGSARRHVVSMQVVLADGTPLEIGRESAAPAAKGEPPSRRQELVGQLASLLADKQDLIARCQPKSLVNRSGYHLQGVLNDGHLDLPQLLAGSEGTLALITEMTLATQELARHRGIAALFFDRLENASKAVLEILPFGPCACDLMDRRHLALARESDVRREFLIPPNAEAMLLVEHEGPDAAEVRERLRQIVDRVRRRKRLAFDARQVFDQEEMESFWQLARQVIPTLHKVKGAARPLPIVEDIAVPPASLTEFLITLQNVLKRHQVTASLFAHAGHGQLHVRPFLNPEEPADLKKLEPLAQDLYQAVFAVGGTISGEHGDGLSRTPFVRQQYGDLYPVFAEVKRIFDPQGIFNPGKVIWDEVSRITDHLRPAPDDDATPVQEGVMSSPPEKQLVNLQLQWSPDELEGVARNCNGCGVCRLQSSDTRMCPIFRFAPSEDASPRAKANLIRGLLAGELPPTALASEDFKAVADLCVGCHMCRLECPTAVDVPKIMLEGKAAYTAANGLPFSDWLLARLEWLSAAGSTFSRFSNWALSNRQCRWLAEKILGLAQARKLPRFTSRSFMRRAARRRLTRPPHRSGRRVLYFVDLYANYHDPQLAEAFLAVMEHNAVSVYVHPDQQPSGIVPLSLGAVHRAKRFAARNLPLLAEAVRQGYQIVTSEPSTALCLTREYPSLINDDDARLVAANTSEACTYLWKMHQSGSLQLDFQPVNANLGYHLPCHLKALEVGLPGLSLLRLVPGLTVQRIERGCSGMAGMFGLKRSNFRNSVRAGWGLISSLRNSDIQAGTTECSSCKMQMEQGTVKPTLHPLKILAHAYGLMPEVASQLTARGEELVVT
ncbi:MAG: FAD-binding and (Fe-S)-binding domain-containing protein [Pirellulales bacterium]